MIFELDPQDLERIAEAVAGKLAVPSASRWLNRSEAADYLRLSTKQLDRLVSAGEIPAYRPTSKPLFCASQLDEYVLRCA